MGRGIEKGLAKLSERLKATWPEQGAFGHVKLDFGYFANVLDLGWTGLAISTDGVGTKAMIATMLERYDTIGIDCVAMNVNDIICVGATPFSMVDYIALDWGRADFVDQLAEGLLTGGTLAGVSIVGGETAVMDDMINGFDLAGTAIGFVALDHIIQGEHIQRGDALIGIESNGIHANGFTLAREVFNLHFNYGMSYCRKMLTSEFNELGSHTTLGDELMRPTHIYTQEVAHLIRNITSLRALIHITGDGLLNLCRVKSPAGFIIESWPQIPSIFKLIQRRADVSDELMWETFNMGIGFCAVVAPNDVSNAIDTITQVSGKRAYHLGYADFDHRRRIKLVAKGLIGEGKKFGRVLDGGKS